MTQYHSLSHSKWDCKYHLVFNPKKRRKVFFGIIRREIGPIFRELAEQKGCRVIEGHLMADHVHMCIEVPLSQIRSLVNCGLYQREKRDHDSEAFFAKG